MIERIRTLLWRLLGVDRTHLLRSIDFTYLQKDKFSMVGDRTYQNGAKVWRWSDAPLRIGKYCSIANNVNFILDEANHCISKITNFPLFDNLFSESELICGATKLAFLNEHNSKNGIEIGNDVWIGMGAIILSGVRIGNGSVIGAGSVVTQNVEDYCVVGGVPAKVIRHKCDEDHKEAMNNIAWWNWKEVIIKERIDDFRTLSIAEFVKKYKNHESKV